MKMTGLKEENRRETKHLKEVIKSFENMPSLRSSASSSVTSIMDSQSHNVTFPRTTRAKSLYDIAVTINDDPVVTRRASEQLETKGENTVLNGPLFNSISLKVRCLIICFIGRRGSLKNSRPRVKTFLKERKFERYLTSVFGAYVIWTFNPILESSEQKLKQSVPNFGLRGPIRT